MQIKPKKSLGQNFLIDKNIQKKIIAACQLQVSDNVLEIGAGRGELTRLIAGSVTSVWALEIDPQLCQTLKDNLKENPNVKIINQDLLKVNLTKHFAKITGKIKVIGNIPYYITTPIIEHLLRYQNKITTIFITVQKEFARRITATPGSKEYGAFSCFIQYHTQPKILFFIKKTCFFPPPKVDSALLQLDLRQAPPVKIKSEKLFFKIIRAAFNQRRKTLKNSLGGSIPQRKLTGFFIQYGIDPRIRPEDLSLEDFANLANI